MTEPEKCKNAEIKPIVLGFVLSLICTILAYGIVAFEFFRPVLYVFLVSCLGILQFVFFMHFFFRIGRGEDAKSNLLMLALMVIVAVVIVLGSIWIMNNLNYYMM